MFYVEHLCKSHIETIMQRLLFHFGLPSVCFLASSSAKLCFLFHQVRNLIPGSGCVREKQFGARMGGNDGDDDFDDSSTGGEGGAGRGPDKAGVVGRVSRDDDRGHDPGE